MLHKYINTLHILGCIQKLFTLILSWSKTYGLMREEIYPIYLINFRIGLHFPCVLYHLKKGNITFKICSLGHCIDQLGLETLIYSFNPPILSLTQLGGKKCMGYRLPSLNSALATKCICHKSLKL